jgi:hypothetical protein
VRIGIYARISDDRDGRQTATARQLEDCGAFAAKKGWEVADEFEDIDTSAYKANIKRPQFARMLAALSNGEIDGVVVWKLDRLSRQQRDLVRVTEACEVHKEPVSVVAVRPSRCVARPRLRRGPFGCLASTCSNTPLPARPARQGWHRRTISGSKRSAVSRAGLASVFAEGTPTLPGNPARWCGLPVSGELGPAPAREWMRKSGALTRTPEGLVSFRFRKSPQAHIALDETLSGPPAAIRDEDKENGIDAFEPIAYWQEFSRFTFLTLQVETQLDDIAGPHTTPILEADWQFFTFSTSPVANNSTSSASARRVQSRPTARRCS